MGYKVEIRVLEGLKKTLETNNKLLNQISQSQNEANKKIIAKQIAKNDKQIKLLKNEYYID